MHILGLIRVGTPNLTTLPNPTQPNRVKTAFQTLVLGTLAKCSQSCILNTKNVVIK